MKEYQVLLNSDEKNELEALIYSAYFKAKEHYQNVMKYAEGDDPLSTPEEIKDAEQRMKYWNDMYKKFRDTPPI